MFDSLDWWGYVVLAALPSLGFLLGVHWSRRNPQKPHASSAPVEPLQERMLEALDSVQRQVEELAERQDFAERLLASKGEPKAKLESRVPTPV